MYRPEFRRGLRLAPALLVTALILMACSPRYNWRVAAGNDVFTATFPAHVAKETRPVQIAGLSASMTMTGAQVDGVSFIVGVADFPPGSDLALLPAAFASEMAKNLASPAPQLQAVAIAQQGSKTPLAGSGFELGNGTMSVTGRVVAHGDHVIEVLVSGPVAAFKDQDTAEARDTFLQSVSIY